MQNSRIPIDGTVTHIADYAFAGCQDLTAITIPSVIDSIGAYAFSSCTGLTDIHFLGTKLQWQQLEKGENWDYNAGTHVVHCTDGDLI